MNGSVDIECEKQINSSSKSKQREPSQVKILVPREDKFVRQVENDTTNDNTSGSKKNFFIHIFCLVEEVEDWCCQKADQRSPDSCEKWRAVGRLPQS